MRMAFSRGALGLVLLGPALAAAAAPAPAELRGLWVVRTALVSPQAVDQAVDAAAAAGMNALFVQVRGRGDAFYRSSLAARSPLLERQRRDFDPFARLLTRARAKGMQVHAWVNVLLAAHFGQPLPRGHVLLKHPAVAECCVVAYRQDDLEKPIAFVIPKPGAPTGPTVALEIAAFAKSHLAAYKFPRRVKFVNELPRNDRGKVERKRLREDLARGGLEGSHDTDLSAMTRQAKVRT